MARRGGGSFVDLLHGQMELRFCSALAIILNFESERRPVLKAILSKIIRGSWNSAPSPGARKRKPPFSVADLDGEHSLRNVHVQVEEPIRGRRGYEGRLDLTIRFDVREKEYLLIIEAKVAATGAHGRQFKTIREQFAKWNVERAFDGSAERNRIFGILGVGPPDEFVWGTDGSIQEAEVDKSMVDFWLRWRDVRDILTGAIEAQEDTEFTGLIRNFVRSIRWWTMDLEDFRKALKFEHPPFPMVMEALVEFIEKLSSATDGSRINWEPRGASSPVWEDGDKQDGYDGMYWWGAWWKTNGSAWFGAYLAWYYFDKLPGRAHEFDGTVALDDGSGYIEGVEFWRSPTSGDAEDSVCVGFLTLRQFTDLLAEDKFGELVKWIRDGFPGNPPFERRFAVCY